MQWWQLRRQVHISWLIAIGSAGILAGVIVAHFISDWHASDSIWLLAGIALAGIGLWQGKWYAVGFIIVAGMMIGMWRGGVEQAKLAPYEKLVGHTTIIEGFVSDDPEEDKKNGRIFKLGVESVDGRSLSGTIWMTSHEDGDIKRGDKLTAKGVIKEGFGGFAASIYRADIQAVSRPIPGDLAGRVKEWFSAQVARVIAMPEAALGLGFLTGQKQLLPADLEEAMKLAGLTHIVVASGYNLTILVRLSRRFFAKISKYLAAFSGMSLIAGFIAVTGFSPSMSRAGLVAGLSLLAWYYGRKFHPIVLLLFVAAVTVLVNPAYAWGDLGWLLSFAAFAGVMLIAPLFQTYFFGDKKPGALRQIIGETIAAQLATLPILIMAFGQFSNVALPANLLIVPFVPLAMALVFLAGVLAFLFIPLGEVVGWFAQHLLSYMVLVTQWFASLSWATTTVSVTWYVGLLLYGGLVALCIYAWRKTRYDFRSASLVD